MIAERFLRWLLGIWLVLLFFLLSGGLVYLWPQPGSPANAPTESRYLLIVLFAGALGSYIHLATSFVDFTGNRKFVASWAWWYVLRCAVGACLAVLVYCTFRGSLVQGGGENLNPYGIVSLSGMAGLFSRQATDKLREVFENLFRTDSAPLRHDPLPSAGSAPEK